MKLQHRLQTLKSNSSPDEAQEGEQFKTPNEDSDLHKPPNENSGNMVVLMKPSEFKRMAASNEFKIEDHFYFGQDIAQDNFVKLRKILTSKKNAFRRLSDLSGLTMTTSSSGYRADTSSCGASDSSNVSKQRDRLSIMPEETIAPHKVLSPLPKRLWSTPKLPTKIDSQDVGNVSLVLDIGTPVFAKWVERTDIKFWPGTIKGHADNDKYCIHFEDGYEKDVKSEDILRADGLLPSLAVNVEMYEGLHQVGVILSFADCSQEGQIFYNVQVDAKPTDRLQKVSFDSRSMERNSARERGEYTKAKGQVS